MPEKKFQKAFSSRIQPCEIMDSGHALNERFVHVPGNVEWAELYRKGGYHPIHLGEVFAHRYRVLCKLGDGGSIFYCLVSEG